MSSLHPSADRASLDNQRGYVSQQLGMKYVGFPCAGIGQFRSFDRCDHVFRRDEIVPSPSGRRAHAPPANNGCSLPSRNPLKIASLQESRGGRVDKRSVKSNKTPARSDEHLQTPVITQEGRPLYFSGPVLRRLCAHGRVRLLASLFSQAEGLLLGVRFRIDNSSHFGASLLCAPLQSPSLTSFISSGGGSTDGNPSDSIHSSRPQPVVW